MTTRVFHPALDTWQDVPADAVPEWEAAGWLAEKPSHVDDSGSPVEDTPRVPVAVTDNTPTHLPDTPVTDNTPQRRVAAQKG